MLVSWRSRREHRIAAAGPRSGAERHRRRPRPRRHCRSDGETLFQRPLSARSALRQRPRRPADRGCAGDDAAPDREAAAVLMMTARWLATLVAVTLTLSLPAAMAQHGGQE